MQADGRGRARFLCGLALWMITVAAAHRHGANARMLHRRDTRSDCAGHGKFDCLDRRAPLRMLGGYRARRLARLHIRMLNDGDGGAALPAKTHGEGAKFRRTPMSQLRLRSGAASLAVTVQPQTSGVSFEPFPLRHLRQPGDHSSKSDRGSQPDPMPTLRRGPRNLGRAQGTRGS
jgi:hypothetical protein